VLHELYDSHELFTTCLLLLLLSLLLLLRRLEHLHVLLPSNSPNLTHLNTTRFLHVGWHY
jgi:hypothetical protein